MKAVADQFKLLNFDPKNVYRLCGSLVIGNNYKTVGKVFVYTNLFSYQLEPASNYNLGRLNEAEWGLTINSANIVALNNKTHPPPPFIFASAFNGRLHSNMATAPSVQRGEREKNRAKLLCKRTRHAVLLT